VHYDLSWNPTRHEQREGRVDRYGQRKPKVRMLTYYGVDNQIDGIVLDVLLRKHRTIRNSLGISVPVPVDTDQVIEAVFEGLLLRSGSAQSIFQGLLPGLEEYLKPKKDELYRQWEQASDREKRSRTMFAQQTIKVEEVSKELHAAQAAVGLGVDVETFTRSALRASKAVIKGEERIEVDLREIPQALRDILGIQNSFEARFQLPVQENEILLTRTHPLVEGLAAYLMEAALDGAEDSTAKRCGAIRTRSVAKRTTLLLVRYRYHILTHRADQDQPLLAEEVLTLAFEGSPKKAIWLESGQAEALLAAESDENIQPAQSVQFVRSVLESFEAIQPHLEQTAVQRAEILLEAHQRVRSAAGIRGVRYQVEPQLPPDILGVYVYLPGTREGA